MCGITGFVEGRASVKYEGAVVLDRMCRIIAHRGPDDQGVMFRGGAALGMRRLSIIDLAGGHQPISGEDGSVSVVFNGEIYNFRELQTLLESQGHRFHSRLHGPQYPAARSAEQADRSICACSHQGSAE